MNPYDERSCNQRVKIMKEENGDHETIKWKIMKAENGDHESRE